MKNRLIVSSLVLLSAVLLSMPWLLPHSGPVILIAFFPLLLAEQFASHLNLKHFFCYYYAAFVLWNAFTTFWVCNATVAGGIFAIFANALQMAVVFGIFRFARRKMGGVLPYIMLAVTWIAWERAYMDAQISWPWLVLGNAFAGTTGLVQWYEWTGTLGGSLWVWIVNLALYGVFVSVMTGAWHFWTRAARVSAVVALLLFTAGPIAVSQALYNRDEASDGEIEVLVAQPNLDPYHKFESMSQAEQTSLLLSLYEDALNPGDSLLLLAPETFTSDIVLNDIGASPTVRSMSSFLDAHPGCEMLFGASTYSVHDTRSAPSPLARQYGDRWLESHNTALLLDGEGNVQTHQKSKLVVGVELTPYPELMIPVEKWVCGIIGENPPLMGRCVGQESPSVLNYRDSIGLGCAVCYESIYGEYCTSYVRKGAQLLTVITNDAWWGDTPGYRQHCNYSRLRAVELRRDVARCGNTGISCLIDSKGDVLQSGPWWEPYTLRGKLRLHERETLFVRYGDICGRVCTLMFFLLALLLFVRLFRRS